MLFLKAWILIGAGMFGAVIGSFLNVVILRLPRQESIVHPRSRCGACGEMIRWYDNIPVLSWLILLRGKCRHCGVAISPRYALVELLTALLTVFLAYRLFMPPIDAGNIEVLGYPVGVLFAVELLFVYALIAATFIDLDHTIIPDEITKPGMAIAIAAGLVVPQLHGTDNPVTGLGLAALGAATGAFGIWAVRIGGRLAFRKEAMGFGDVKYMGLIGGILGWKGVVLTFFLACLIGSVVGVFVLVVKKSRYIPFAPFLSAGAAIMLFFGDEVWKFLREDYPAFIRNLMG